MECHYTSHFTGKTPRHQKAYTEEALALHSEVLGRLLSFAEPQVHCGVVWACRIVRKVQRSHFWE